MKKLTFIATDLETTGLSPVTDTIIEVAAMRFDLVFDGENFSIENIDERTMLVNPDKPLEDDIILITHITNEMLAGKPKWTDIQPKIRDFFTPDAIILGHNVFFDIAMFASHGIDLATHPILDTFELSEILAQDAPSLNLGFLGDHYGVEKKWQEHRALTDVKICVDVLVKFLEQIRDLSDEKKFILQKFLFAKNGEFGFLWDFLEEIFVKNTFSDENFKNGVEKFSTKNTEKNATKNFENISENENFPIISLENTENAEKNFIKKILEEKQKIKIITQNKKIAETLARELNAENIDSIVKSEHYQFANAEEICKILEKIEVEKFERKYHIFLVKLAFWLVDTKTGLLSELKYYGHEFDWTHNFRLAENENNIFLVRHEEEIFSKKIILEPFHKNLKTDTFSLYKDISLVEGTMRKIFSHAIDFEKLISEIENFGGEISKKICENLRLIESIYLATPKRPTGDNPVPPWKYGETYFFSQNELWCTGFKWLSLANKELFENFLEWKKIFENNNSREKNLIFAKICTDISRLVEFHTQEMPEMGVIITILENNTTIELISRKLPDASEKFFKNAMGYGFHLGAESIENFLISEIPAKIILEKNPETTQITEFENIREAMTGEKILVLTTSMKHIREIGAKLKNFSENILLQGTSGGKSKMKHYFAENSGKSVLVGLIDTWRDEADILSKIDTLVIAKIPFDPPTDPYFLAKTIGMKNSFELYSKPIVLSRLNALIGNAKNMNPSVKIICADERITTTEWGKFMQKNLF